MDPHTTPGRLDGILAALPGLARMRRRRHPDRSAPLPVPVPSTPQAADEPAPAAEQTGWPSWRGPR